MFVNLTTVVTSDCFSISVSRYLSLYFTCFSRLCLFTRAAANANSGPDSLTPLCDVTHSRAGLFPPLSPSLPPSLTSPLPPRRPRGVRTAQSCLIAAVAGWVRGQTVDILCPRSGAIGKVRAIPDAKTLFHTDETIR